jgi:hypothetical protein
MEKYFSELKVVERFEDKIADLRATPFYMEVQKFVVTPAPLMSDEYINSEFPIISQHAYKKTFSRDEFNENLAEHLNIPPHLQKDFDTLAVTGTLSCSSDSKPQTWAESENPYNWFVTYLNKWEDDLQDALDAIEWDYASGKTTTTVDTYYQLEETPSPLGLYEIEKNTMDPYYRSILDKLEAVEAEFRSQKE